MTTTCGELIRSILASRKSRERATGDPTHVVVERLIELSTECRQELQATAVRLIAELPVSSEGDIGAVLEALFWLKDSKAEELICQALHNRYTMQKEDYVAMLEDLDAADQAITALLAILDAGRTDPTRPDLPVTIRALHSLRYKAAASQIAKYINHPDRGVRGLAAAFLYEFGDAQAAEPNRIVASNN